MVVWGNGGGVGALFQETAAAEVVCEVAMCLKAVSDILLSLLMMQFTVYK